MPFVGLCYNPKQINTDAVLQHGERGGEMDSRLFAFSLASALAMEAAAAGEVSSCGVEGSTAADASHLAVRSDGALVCDGRPVFLASVSTEVTTLGEDYRAKQLRAEAAARYPDRKWFCGEPNTAAKFRRMGLNALWVFPPLNPDLLKRRHYDSKIYLSELAKRGDMPVCLDVRTRLGAGKAAAAVNFAAALPGNGYNPDEIFVGDHFSSGQIPFRLSSESGVAALTDLLVARARQYRDWNVKPWAYKILNEPHYADDSTELDAMLERRFGGEVRGLREIESIKLREELVVRACRHVREAIRREVQPDAACFVQATSQGWKLGRRAIDLYAINRGLDIVSIGTGGYCYVNPESAPEGTRFAEAEDPGVNLTEHLGKIAFYRAMARGKPMVASELYFPGIGRDRSRELESTLVYGAADGVSMANLWEWGKIKTQPSTTPFQLSNTAVCPPSTWDVLPRTMKEINDFADFFPVAGRRERARVACIFSNPTRRAHEERLADYCRAVAALELAHIRTDAIFEEQLTGDDERLFDYEVVVAAGVEETLDATDAALVKWMEGGGHLVVIGGGMDKDEFRRARTPPPLAVRHANAAGLPAGEPIFRLAVALRERLAAWGVRPVADVRDAATGDTAPFIRVAKAKVDGMTGWFFANYSETARLIVVSAPELETAEAAVDPFGTNRWPLADGGMAVLVPPRFHARAVSGPEAAVSARFGPKVPVAVSALKAECGRMVAEAKVAAPRRPSKPVDLRQVANGGFDNRQNWPVDTAWDDSRGRHLRGVPHLGQTFGHIDFDIIRFDYNDNRTTVALRSAARPDGLSATPAVAVDGQIRGLAILAAAVHAQKGETAATLVVEYSDGGSVRQPLVVGREIGDWQIDANDETLRGKCAWSNPEGKGFFLYEWENREPSRKVKSFSFVGGEGQSAANIVAVTRLPTRFAKAYAHCVDLERAAFPLGKGERRRYPVTLPPEALTGVIRLQATHPPRKQGAKPSFGRVGIAAVGRLEDGTRVSTKRSIAIDRATLVLMAESVASADEWAELEIPINSSLIQGRGKVPGGMKEGRMAAIDEIVISNPWGDPHVYREIRIEY